MKRRNVEGISNAWMYLDAQSWRLLTNVLPEDYSKQNDMDNKIVSVSQERIISLKWEQCKGKEGQSHVMLGR